MSRRAPFFPAEAKDLEAWLRRCTRGQLLEIFTLNGPPWVRVAYGAGDLSFTVLGLHRVPSDATTGNVPWPCIAVSAVRKSGIGGPPETFLITKVDGSVKVYEWSGSLPGVVIEDGNVALSDAWLEARTPQISSGPSPPRS